jgi:hypothetical protein
MFYNVTAGSIMGLLSIIIIIIIIIIIMALQPFVGPWPLFSVSCSYTQSVGLLGRGISSSQGLYLHTEHKHRINTNTNIHASSGIRTHDPSVWVGEDSSCLRPRDHSDRSVNYRDLQFYVVVSKRKLWKFYKELHYQNVRIRHKNFFTLIIT